jgi:hypothetical protein
MVSKGQVAQKGTRQMKLSFSQTILEPSGMRLVFVAIEGAAALADGKVSGVGVVGGVGSDSTLDSEGDRHSSSMSFVIDDKDSDPSVFVFLSASVSVLT